MTPEQRLIAKWVFILLLFVGVFFGGYGVRGYMAEHEITVVQLDHQKAVSATLAQYSNDLLDLTVRNQALRNIITKLDARHSKDFHDQLEKNRNLRADLDVAQRMSLKGTHCPKQAAAASGVASTPSVGDGTPVLLSGETRLAVFDLREDLLRDRAQLKYLQEERLTLTCSPTKSG